MHQRAHSTIPPIPATACIEILVRANVLDVLRAKNERIAEGGRFADLSTTDEFGWRRARGGFFNAHPDHAALGYGKGDVAEVERDLRKRGLRIAKEDVDGLISQIVREGSLAGVELAVSVGGKPVIVKFDREHGLEPEPPRQEVRIGNFVVVALQLDLVLVRPVGATGLAETCIVIGCGREALCTCLQPACEHVRAVTEMKTSRGRKTTTDIVLSDAEHTVVARTLVAMLEPHGLLAPSDGPRAPGNQPRSTAARAFHLLLRSLLGTGYEEHPDAQKLVEAGLIDEPASRSTRRRYRDDAAVVALLRELRVIATRTMRAHGAATEHLLIETDRGDLLAADVVAALRLGSRVTKLDQLNPILENF